MEPVPFKLINAAEWSRVRATSEQIMAAWKAHWLPDEVPGQVECADAFTLPAKSPEEASLAEPSCWRCYVAGGQPVIHARTSASWRSALSEAVFGAVVNRFDASGTGNSLLLSGVIDAALTDLASRFAEAAGVAAADALTLRERDAAPATALTRRGAGAVRVQWCAGKVGAQLILGGALIGSLLATMPRSHGPARPLTALTHDLILRPLCLRAWAGDVEIALGEIGNLAPGDVVQLDARVDQPFRLTLDGATVAARGYLGSSHGRKAMRLVPHESTLEPHT